MIKYTFGSSDEVMTTWTYETVANKKTLVSVDVKYPTGHKHADTDKIYINPANGKVISKARAYQLGVKNLQD